MAELATIARPYANAVFSLGKREGTLDQWSSMLRVLDVASRDARVRVLLSSPELPAQAKAYRLADIAGDALDDRGKKFLQALAEHDRLGLIAEIREQYDALRAEEERSLEVEVVTAYPLSEAETATLERALHQKFDKDVSIESRVDSGLIGGAIIRAGDTVIDGSVRGKLNKLVETLVH